MISLILLCIVSWMMSLLEPSFSLGNKFTNRYFLSRQDYAEYKKIDCAEQNQ